MMSIICQRKIFIIVKLLTLSSQSKKDLHYSGRNFITRFAGKTQLILCIYRLKGTPTGMFKKFRILVDYVKTQ